MINIGFLQDFNVITNWVPEGTTLDLRPCGDRQSREKGKNQAGAHRRKSGQ